MWANLGDPNETFILVGQTNSDYVFYYWQKSILRVGEIVSESERWRQDLRTEFCHNWQKSILIVGGIVSQSERWRQGQFWQVGFLLSSSTTQRPARSKQANKQRWQKDSKKWASCFPALPHNGPHRADIFLANLKIAHFRPFMGRLCLLKWPEASKWWPELIAEIRFLGFSYITSHLV